MKDNISLIAAAAGGFMLSLAVASIIKAAPVTSLKVRPSPYSNPVANLRLQPVHPDEPVSYTLENRFSLENSLQALDSLQQLTEKRQAAKNNASETQTLEFYNWVGAIEGTLKKQEYQLKKLEFELAQERYKTEKINKTTLDQKANQYQKSKQEFQAFWQSFGVAD